MTDGEEKQELKEITGENPLLHEVKQGLAPKVSEKKEDKEKTKEEMGRILAELKQKMREIDRITADLRRKKLEEEKDSPKKTERILHEIKVPPLEMLK